MSAKETPDAVLERARYAERLAKAAEALRTTIRVGGVARWRTTRSLVFHSFTGEKIVPDDQVTAIYEALADVRDRHAAAAQRERARLRVEEPTKEKP